MSVGVLKDYKLKLRDLRASHIYTKGKNVVTLPHTCIHEHAFTVQT
jgi:hypothetical protein